MAIVPGWLCWSVTSLYVPSSCSSQSLFDRRHYFLGRYCYFDAASRIPASVNLISLFSVVGCRSHSWAAIENISNLYMETFICHRGGNSRMRPWFVSRGTDPGRRLSSQVPITRLDFLSLNAEVTVWTLQTISRLIFQSKQIMARYSSRDKCCALGSGRLDWRPLILCITNPQTFKSIYLSQTAPPQSDCEHCIFRTLRMLVSVQSR
jgi:hypothetical protein